MTVFLICPVFHMADSFLKGLFSSCNCPCRTYRTRRCVTTYQERCHQGGNCFKYPLVVAKYVKETECQKCQEFQETQMMKRGKIQCSPVYDEACLTKYTPTCSYSRQCKVSYHKDCSSREYSGSCVDIPVENCTKVKKCSRKPETKCRPVERLECGLEGYHVPKKVKKQKCLPFPPTPPPEEDCSVYSTHHPPSHKGLPNTRRTDVFSHKYIVIEEDYEEEEDDDAINLLSFQPSRLEQSFHSSTHKGLPSTRHTDVSSHKNIVIEEGDEEEVEEDVSASDNISTRAAAGFNPSYRDINIDDGD